MKEKNKRQVLFVIVVLALVVAIVISTIVLLHKNEQNTIQEISQTANAKEEMYAEMVEDISDEEKVKKMTELEKGWDKDKVTSQKIKLNEGGSEEIPVPIPNGYTVSKVTGETTVNGGLVIYEGTTEVTDDNKDEAQKSRNQWVWVPVYDPSDMYGTDANGKMWGKLYNFNSDGRTADNWSEQDGKMTISNKTDDREPDLSSYYDKDDNLSKYLSETDKEQLSKELKNTFEKTIESIEKYGGFYIGRYETGGLDETAKVVKGDTNISNQTWYTMYEKCKTLKGENRNVETNMIWGCEWDRTLQWFVDTSEDKTKAYKDVGSDSSRWGNYNRSKKETGSAEIYKRNNIYDMGGNVWDWTLEAYGTSTRRIRGGGCDCSSSYRKAGSRYYDQSNYSLDNYGCRASLYVEL